MSTESTAYSAEDIRRRRRRGAQLGVLMVFFGILALPAWLAYQEWTMPAVFILAVFVTVLAIGALAAEVALAMAPTIRGIRRLFSRR